MKLYRHGDLSFTPIKKLPDNLKVVKNPVLAYGETTGHKHQLLERTSDQFQVLEDNAGNKYLKINEPTDLVHEEHKKITIEKGLYFVRNEREYNYFELQSQRVVD
jgi:hypothetical protein